MPSSPQTITTRGVFDYLESTAGKPIVGATVNCTLSFNGASVTSPVVNVGELQQSTTTDQNGFWRFNLIPNDTLTPTGTVYIIQTPVNSYEISVPTGGADVQSSSILVNVPSVLSPALTGLTGPITVTGNETVTGTLTVQGVTALQSGASVTGGSLGVGTASPSDLLHIRSGNLRIDTQPGVNTPWVLQTSNLGLQLSSPLANTSAVYVATERGSVTSTAKAAFRAMNTDFTADQTNFESVDFEAEGLDNNYYIKTRIGGTGIHRPFRFQIGGFNALTISIAHDVHVGDWLPGSANAETTNPVLFIHGGTGSAGSGRSAGMQVEPSARNLFMWSFNALSLFVNVPDSTVPTSGTGININGFGYIKAVGGSTPTITGVNAGISGTPTVTGNGVHGTISFTTTGTPPGAGSNLFTVNFVAAYVATPGVWISTSTSSQVIFQPSSVGTSSFTVLNAQQALANTTTYTLSYLVHGN